MSEIAWPVSVISDGMKDGPRYRMMGNAVTVNVAHWIGERIMDAAE